MKTIEGSSAMRRRAFAVLTLAVVLAGVFAVIAMGRGDQSSRAVRIRMGGDPNAGFRFQGVPRNLSAGSVKFTFRNTSSGPIQHNFTVVRTFGRARRFASPTVAAGQSATRTVNLRAGTYVALCTVFNGGHAANGMLVAFQVR
jgi:uncharacterized cupredoxin-like copper-binding protein